LLLFRNAVQFNQPDSTAYIYADTLYNAFLEELKQRWGERVAQAVREVRKGRLDLSLTQPSTRPGMVAIDDRRVQPKRRRMNDGSSRKSKYVESDEDEDDGESGSDDEEDDGDDSGLPSAARRATGNTSKVEKILADRPGKATVRDRER
jgi:hypothetical protein